MKLEWTFHQTFKSKTKSQPLDYSTYLTFLSHFWPFYSVGFVSPWTLLCCLVEIAPFFAHWASNPTSSYHRLELMTIMWVYNASNAILRTQALPCSFCLSPPHTAHSSFNRMSSYQNQQNWDTSTPYIDLMGREAVTVHAILLFNFPHHAYRGWSQVLKK